MSRLIWVRKVVFSLKWLLIRLGLEMALDGGLLLGMVNLALNRILRVFAEMGVMRSNVPI